MALGTVLWIHARCTKRNGRSLFRSRRKSRKPLHVQIICGAGAGDAGSAASASSIPTNEATTKIGKRHVAGWASGGKKFDTRLAAHLFLLGAGTLGLTAAFYGLDHRAYFSQWHAAPFTVTWSIQYFFTVAGAFYQFAAFGMRLYLPIGIPALCLFALWHAAKAR